MKHLVKYFRYFSMDKFQLITSIIDIHNYLQRVLIMPTASADELSMSHMHVSQTANGKTWSLYHYFILTVNSYLLHLLLNELNSFQVFQEEESNSWVCPRFLQPWSWRETKKKQKNESPKGASRDVTHVIEMNLEWFLEYIGFNMIKKLVRVGYLAEDGKDLGSMELKFVKTWEVERTFSDLREQMWRRGWFPLLKWRACIIISPIIAELLLSTIAITPDATPKWRVNSKRSHIPGYAKCVFKTLTFL